MARLPLHTLPAFRAVARTHSVRSAAEELHLTPSAVSQQIRQLEAQTGLALFDRRGRRVVLNPAGEALQRAVEAALAQLDEGLRSAAAIAAGEAWRLRITMLPSFAQRWLLPRMARWRQRFPDIALEVHTSQNAVDLVREGFHAALRQGNGHWRGLAAEPLTHSPLVAVGTPDVAQRLQAAGLQALVHEPLLGDAQLWDAWFSLGGLRVTSNPVATFNDAGLMLQAAEQGIGVALARELLAADALAEGRLVRLSPLALPDPIVHTLWLAHPPELAQWPPIQALRGWLHEELAHSLQALPRGTAAGD